MNRAFSIYLDVLRLFAALMVLFAHWAFPRFTGSDHLWMRHHDLGGDGVVIFFVLSGMLIAFAAQKRADEGPRLFAADRLSRLWSVAVPALIFCYLLDLLGQRVGPDLYAAVGYTGGVSLEALFKGVLFTNQIWFTDAQPGSNGPYWSLGYEAWYYLIFAAFFFAPKTWRWWAAGGLALVAGPKILLLAPSWILGVFVWRAIDSGWAAQFGRGKGALLAVLPVALYLAAHAANVHVNLYNMTGNLFGDAGMRMLGFSDTFLWSALLGPLMAAHILGMAAFLTAETKVPAWVDKTEPAIRWLAGGSFALYLIHFPVLHLAASVLPGDVLDTWRQVLLIVIPVVVAYAFAEISERRRPALRDALRRIFTQSAAKHRSKIPLIEP